MTVRTETVTAGQVRIGDVLHLPGGYKSQVVERTERNLQPGPGTPWVALQFNGSTLSIVRFQHEPVVREVSP